MLGPLEGIRVLDLSWILSGPFATMTLSDLGAEVIKIEQPGSGDRSRGTGPFIDGDSSYFMSINRGKTSLTLNLAVPKGKELFLDLVQHADVVMENFRPGTMQRLGLDYPILKERNPTIIYCAISGFGQTGPYSRRPALDVIVQGMGGIMSITGETGGSPVRVGSSIGDITAGLYAAVGILSALHERSTSGQGQMIDISMMDCQVSILENAMSRYFATGEVPGRLGTRHPAFTPFQAFNTKDGHIVIALAGGTGNQWPLFCAAIGNVELIDDPRFETGWSRTEHYDVLEPILSNAMLKKTTQQWLDELLALEIPCGPVNTIDQIATDPQIEFREMLTEVPHKRLGQVKVTNTPVKLSRTPGRIQGSPPDLGEHSEETLNLLLGLSSAEVTELRDGGVV